MRKQIIFRVLGMILLAVAVGLVVPALLHNLQKYAMQDPALLASVGWNF
jgi:hypothetical protein